MKLVQLTAAETQHAQVLLAYITVGSSFRFVRNELLRSLVGRLTAFNVIFVVIDTGTCQRQLLYLRAGFATLIGAKCPERVAFEYTVKCKYERLQINVKQSRYRPGVAQSVPGSEGSQIT